MTASYGCSQRTLKKENKKHKCLISETQEIVETILREHGIKACPIPIYTPGNDLNPKAKTIHSSITPRQSTLDLPLYGVSVSH